MKMHLLKYHGLGNDYLIAADADAAAPEKIDVELVRRLCVPHYGLGSDGILYGPYLPGTPFFASLGIPEAVAAFRIINPDGSEAEKSGNGVRIFTRYLYDIGVVRTDVPFTLATLGGPIRCLISDPRSAIRCEMGQVSFDSSRIPVAGDVREVLHERIKVNGQEVEFCAATVGNPHCIVITPGLVTPESAMALGPALECADIFPNRTNVQFMEALDEHTIRIEIYERGAGYTLASGTSAAACAATAVRLGWCHSPVTVTMPGGTLEIHVDAEFRVTQCGPAAKVFDGIISLGDDL
ncbi:MAG: diaminopimelate epimerase [Victivallales bacterium]|nr:diaminopimelate epimerase [Victivallales bacterium]